MGSMYLKQKRIQTGFAPSVVEFATAVCVGKQKDGLPPVLFIERYLQEPFAIGLDKIFGAIVAKSKLFVSPDFSTGLQVSCTLSHPNPTTGD